MSTRPWAHFLSKAQREAGWRSRRVAARGRDRHDPERPPRGRPGLRTDSVGDDASTIRRGANVTARFDAIGSSVDGIAADVLSLKAKIDALQASQGSITPEDQALLDSIQAQADVLAGKVSALDAATEAAPEPPVV